MMNSNLENGFDWTTSKTIFRESTHRKVSKSYDYLKKARSFEYSRNRIVCNYPLSGVNLTAISTDLSNLETLRNCINKKFLT